MFDLYQAVGLFFLYAFLGWCVEVAFVAVTCGRVVNRGFLNGPVCPIYGFGMLGVLYLLRPVEENLLLLFLGGMVLASALELAGGWALNRLFHTRWWDYSNEPFNLGGYICLKFSLMWGLGTVMVVRLVHPALYDLFLWIPRRLGVGLEVVLTLIFLADLAATVVTVMGLERDLKELHELAGTLRRDSDKAVLYTSPLRLSTSAEKRTHESQFLLNPLIPSQYSLIRSQNLEGMTSELHITAITLNDGTSFSLADTLPDGQ